MILTFYYEQDVQYNLAFRSAKTTIGTIYIPEVFNHAFVNKTWAISTHENDHLLRLTTLLGHIIM